MDAQIVLGHEGISVIENLSKVREMVVNSRTEHL